MLIAKKTGGGDPLNPEAPEWAQAAPQRVTFAPTPIGLQPTPYIQKQWAVKPYGRAGHAEVRALTDGRSIFIRLDWPDATEDRDPKRIDAFADGAAVVFPVNGDAPLTTMGAPDAPVNAWHWRADLPEGTGRNVLAQGIGTSQESNASAVKTASLWKAGRWAVVFSRPLHVGGAEGGGAELAPGAETKVAFAVWNGSNGERAGIKAWSQSWLSLRVEG
jgi:DMSO reductase family type II enzyme heme b subunit